MLELPKVILGGIVNALIGMSAALITLLVTFEYLERPSLQRRVHRILWGIGE